MKRILLIGAGQLGSRHLQALVKLNQRYHLFVIDPSLDAINLSKQRCSEVDAKAAHIIDYIHSLEELNESHFHYAIIATNAKYRFDIFLKLTEACQIDNIIFEKILFQKAEHYTRAAQLLSDNAIKAWVNCPLRMYPFYKEIKTNYFKKNTPIHYSYRAGEWAGLACNSIHYLDHLNYFTHELPIYFDFSKLDKQLSNSKRAGFVEFTGEFSCEYTNGSLLSMSIIKNSDTPSIIDIKQAEHHLKVEELTGNFSFFKNNLLVEAGHFPPLYQSDLTHSYIEEIEATGTCSLTSYTKSMHLHLPFITGLLEQYELINHTKINVLPIT